MTEAGQGRAGQGRAGQCPHHHHHFCNCQSISIDSCDKSERQKMEIKLLDMDSFPVARSFYAVPEVSHLALSADASSFMCR